MLQDADGANQSVYSISSPMQCLAPNCFLARRRLSLTRHGISDRTGRHPSVRMGPKRRVAVCAANPDPEQIKKLQETMDAAMKENPQVRSNS